MSALRTPGPWATGGIFDPLSDAPTTNVWGPTQEGKQSGQLICQRVSLADAALIVAAPQMWDIVETIAGLIDDGEPAELILHEFSLVLDAIRDVIAKVRAAS